MEVDFRFIIRSDWRMDYNVLTSRNSELGSNDNSDLGRNLGSFADQRNTVDSFISLPGFFKLQSLGNLSLLLFSEYIYIYILSSL